MAFVDVIVRIFSMCMGGGGAAASDADVARSREIEKTIRQDQKRMMKEVKLLLLGEFLASELFLGQSDTNKHVKVPASLESRRFSNR